MIYDSPGGRSNRCGNFQFKILKLELWLVLQCAVGEMRV